METKKIQHKSLSLLLCGLAKDRVTFLQEIRGWVIPFTGEQMRLDALVHEIAKNIYDHAGGRGYIDIERRDRSFHFTISDCGPSGSITKENHPKVNYGQGVDQGLIESIAQSLNIDLKVTHGFNYSGVYTPS